MWALSLAKIVTVLTKVARIAPDGDLAYTIAGTNVSGRVCVPQPRLVSSDTLAREVLGRPRTSGCASLVAMV